LTSIRELRYQGCDSLNPHSRREEKVISYRTCSQLIAFLAFISLIACSQNDSHGAAGASNAVAATPAASSSELDACKLVTKAEAEQVMGEKLKDPDSGPASTAGGTICIYGSPDSMSAKNVTVRVESPNFNWTKFKEDKRVEGEKMAPKKGRIRQVPGLGKDAYFARHVLHVLTDHGILTVIVFKDPADAAAGEDKETKAEAAEKTLAEKAVPRM
jgi:hypothetical protein